MADHDLYSRLKEPQPSEPEEAWLALRERAAGQAERWTRTAWRLLAAPLLLFFLLPILALVLRLPPGSLLRTALEPEVLLAVGVSLKTTLISLGITLLFGTPVAYLLSQRRFRGRSLLDALVDLPTVLPPSVAGLALLLALGRRGTLGAPLAGLGVELSFTQAAVVLAQVFIASPFYIRAATLGFAGIERELIQAAQLDGASRWQIFRYVVLPLSETAILTGAVMSWSRALGEFGATIIFAGNFPGRTQTMPLAIYLGFESNLDVALTLSVILIALAGASLLLARVLAGRRAAQTGV